MHRVIIFVLFAVSGLSTGFCQTADYSHFGSGLRIGINATQVNGDRMAGFNKQGFVGGLYVSHAIADHWEWQFEILFSQKGSRKNFSGDHYDSIGIWDRLNINYAEVPFMLNYLWKRRVKFHAGLGAAYLINSTLEDQSGVVPNAIFLRKVEINGTVGASYRITPRLSLFARYTNSLNNISKGGTNAALYRVGAGLVNIVASFGIYYHFYTADWQ